MTERVSQGQPQGANSSEGFRYAPPPPPPFRYPQGGNVTQSTAKPATYWPLSIAAFVFSYLFGAIAIYYSYQVTKRWDSGDVAGATQASGRAKVWGIVGLVAGALLLLIILGSAGSATTSDSSSYYSASAGTLLS